MRNKYLFPRFFRIFQSIWKEGRLIVEKSFYRGFINILK